MKLLGITNLVDECLLGAHSVLGLQPAILNKIAAARS